MTRRPLAGTVYLRCLAFVITTVLAAPNVEVQDCKRNWKNRKCLIAMGIYLGVVIVVLLGVLLGLYLCDKWFSWRKGLSEWRKGWSNWRKKRRRRPAPTAEENAPLSGWGKTTSDPEDGAAEESKVVSNNGSGGVFVIQLAQPHLGNPSETSLSGVSSVSSPPSYGKLFGGA